MQILFCLPCCQPEKLENTVPFALEFSGNSNQTFWSNGKRPLCLHSPSFSRAKAQLARVNERAMGTSMYSQCKEVPPTPEPPMTKTILILYICFYGRHIPTKLLDYRGSTPNKGVRKAGRKMAQRTEADNNVRFLLLFFDILFLYLYT